MNLISIKWILLFLVFVLPIGFATLSSIGVYLLTISNVPPFPVGKYPKTSILIAWVLVYCFFAVLFWKGWRAQLDKEET